MTTSRLLWRDLLGTGDGNLGRSRGGVCEPPIIVSSPLILNHNSDTTCQDRSSLITRTHSPVDWRQEEDDEQWTQESKNSSCSRQPVMNHPVFLLFRRPRLDPSTMGCTGCPTRRANRPHHDSARHAIGHAPNALPPWRSCWGLHLSFCPTDRVRANTLAEQSHRG
jgi:hypothetical protein